MHRLCIDHEGNYIRRPGEILDEWTLDEVLAAHAVLDWYQECRDVRSAKTKKR